jgi:hypothetical protein
MLGDGTCVDKKDIGPFAPWDCLKAFLQEFSLICRGLRIVQLAA